MKIVTYNIQFSLGKDGNYDLERIASEINGADIIALQEVERNWRRSDGADQPKLLGEFLKHYYWVYGPYFDVDASEPRPDGSIKNVRRQFGNMILSKTPILSTRLFPLPKSALQERHNMVVGVFESVVKLTKGGALRIYNAHLSARSQYDRVVQINAIRDIIRNAPAQGGAWTGKPAHPLWAEDATPPPMPQSFVLLGDFNLESKDPAYDSLVGARDSTSGHIPSGEDFIDTWVATGHQEDAGVTYSTGPRSSENPGMRIDYAFTDETMKTRILNAWIDETALGSDHQPYWIELDYAPL